MSAYNASTGTQHPDVDFTGDGSELQRLTVVGKTTDFIDGDDVRRCSGACGSSRNDRETSDTSRTVDFEISSIERKHRADFFPLGDTNQGGVSEIHR